MPTVAVVKFMTEPRVIYEDENFLAVDKPAGLLVHGARISGSKFPISEQFTLVDWLQREYPEVRTVGDDPETRPGIVHRLDKETSGVMLVARNQKYFEYLKSLFQVHKIKKTYLTVVFGRVEPKSGTIKRPIGLKSGTTKRSVHAEKMLKEAETEYKTIRFFSDKEQATPKSFAAGQAGGGGFSLLEVVPKTGRTHQIRVHFASVGHPVAGDRLYGPRRQPDWIARLMLHSLAVEFATAEGKVLRIEAEPPRDFLPFIQGLNG